MAGRRDALCAGFTRADLVRLCDKAWTDVGGAEGILERLEVSVERAANSPGHEVDRGGGNRGGTLWTFRPPFPPDTHAFFEYRDENATLGRSVVFLGSGDADAARSAGREFVEVLLAMAGIRLHIDVLCCDRAWEQVGMTNLCHAWLHVRDHGAFDRACAPEERDRIEGWIEAHARLLLRDKDRPRWASFRPYDNQEIGIGCLIAEAQVLAERDPGLAAELTALADERVIGWPEKSGNADDTLFYTPVWAKAMYLYATYRPRPEWLATPNCRNTFESFLQQHTPFGMSPEYSQPYPTTCPDMMALGAHLFGNGRYKWMAERMLAYRLEHRPGKTRQTLDRIRAPDGTDWMTDVVRDRCGQYDLVWEGRTSTLFHLWLFWDDGLAAERPSRGSGVLYKTAGSTQSRDPKSGFGDPGPSLPDKIVLREGWDEDSLFALLNVRGNCESPVRRTYCHAHRYPGTNELISIVWGEPFAGPVFAEACTGEFEPRDERIQRRWLNAFWVREKGSWPDSQDIRDEPSGAEVAFFNALPSADLCRTVLSGYRQWTHERTCVLVRGTCLVVFDHCHGPEREVGVRWHLKGEPERLESGAVLAVNGRRLGVFCPLAGTHHLLELRANQDAMPFYEHKADLDLDLLASGSRVGFATVFYPQRPGCGPADISAVRVTTADGDEAHPLAAAVRVGGCLVGTCTNAYPAEYGYEEIRTDAVAFVLQRSEAGLRIEFVEGRTFQLPATVKRAFVDGEPVAATRRGDGSYVELAAPTSGTLDTDSQEEPGGQGRSL